MSATVHISKMDADTATRFITSLTKSLQAVIHGCLDFEKDIELGGYVFLKVDNAQRIDYVLSEKMQKSDLNSMTFHSNSFHALPQPPSDRDKPLKDKNDTWTGSADSAGKSASSERTHSRSNSESPMLSMTHSAVSSKVSHQNPTTSNSRTPNSFMQPKGMGSDELQLSSGPLKLPTSSNRSATMTASEGFRPNDRTQSLTDFQTAFRNPSAALSSQSQQSSSAHSWSLSHNGSSSRLSTSHTLQQQQQQNRSGILPDASDMEVVHIKTEEEDDVFNLPLHCQQGGSESDGLAVQGKAPWLAMRMRQPFYFPYPRLARSQSFDRRMSMPASSPRFPFFSGESSSEAALTCKVCGKSYRSRQGLLFHERAKHQNVFSVYCPVCGKGFQQTTHMYGHMATHTNVKNFQCQACGAKYAHKTSLQQHLRSGSCRASQSQMNSPAGLDLSTSQLLREFTPYSLNETQPRPSSSHSQSQSPLGTDDGDHGHAEGDMALKRLAHFNQTNQLDTDFDRGEKLDRLTDKTTNPNMPKGTPPGNLNLTGGEQGMDQGMTSYGNEPRGLNALSETDTRSLIFSSADESRAMGMASAEEVKGLNLTSRDDTRGSVATSPSSPQALGIDMTKDSQICDDTGSAASDDTHDHHDDAIYGHDSDVPGTVSLSLSADDD